MAKNHLYTLTTGRSGSVFLTELLKQNAQNAAVFHERTGYLNFGTATPDMSDLTVFNSVGNHQKVQNFWKRKFKNDMSFDKPNYIETSHILCKAGLIENIDLLLQQGVKLDLVILRRDVFKIAWSLLNRHDFANLGHTWYYYLDPRYPNKIVNSEPFLPLGPPGWAIWYVMEVFARCDYYKMKLAERSDINLIDIDLSDITSLEGARDFCSKLNVDTVDEGFAMPPKANESKSFVYGEKMEKHMRGIIDGCGYDPVRLAKQYIEMGGDLGRGPKGAR